MKGLILDKRGRIWYDIIYYCVYYRILRRGVEVRISYRGDQSMDDQKTTQGRLALIGITLLTAATLLIWGISFLNFEEGKDPSSGDSSPTTDSAQPNTTDDQQISTVIADVQAKMNQFQTRLDSPYLLLVNESNPLPEGYTVELSSLKGENDDFQLETAAAAQMDQFLDAAQKAGFPVVLSVAYRSQKAQQKAYDDAVKDFMNGGYPVEKARSMAAMKVGSVNCSEHQLGYAVDFKSKDLSLVGNDGETFEEYLTANIHKYGFVLSYPAGGESKTEHEANTAHYRYVGVQAAEAMAEEGWTLPEYRDYLETQINYLKQYIESLQK